MSNRKHARIVSLPLFQQPHSHDRAHAHAPAAVMQEASAPADFETLRQRAAKEHGQRYWRSLQELADTPEFAEYMHREFPANAGEWHDPVSRRNFIKLMGASLALAGIGINTGCEQKEEKIVPYVYPPENIIPGKPLFYATAMPLRSGQAIGVLVEQHMGRPTKIEGNPEHPASLGATDAMTQASVLSLYDPDRSQVVMEAGQITTWSLFFQRMEKEFYENGKPKTGLRIRILTETVCSPTLGDQIRQLVKQFPQSKWHQYEPVNRDNVNVAARSVGNANTYYDFSKAERILSLDCNFLHDEPGSIRYARQYADGRRVRVEEKDEKKSIRRETAAKVKSAMTPVEGGFEMNRLYVAESTPTITGAMADHRLALKPSQIYDLAYAVARAVGVQGATEGRALSADAQKFADAVADDLKKHTGKSLAIAGDHQPPAVHVLCHAINAALQNVGQTVLYTDPVEAEPLRNMTQVESLTALANDMKAGNVDILLMLGGNPVYTAPADLDFQTVLDKYIKPDDKNLKAGLAIHLSPHYDETSFRCTWHIPESHYLEAWGDVRAFDGTVSFQQPLIAPLYGTHSATEVVAGLLLNRDSTGYELVRSYWMKQEGVGGPDFEKTWSRALHDGLLANSAFPTRKVNLRQDLATITKPPAAASAEGTWEVCFRPDPTIWDGRWANNGWLMELPKPLTKITWDNVILVSPKTAAEKFNFRHEDIDERHVPIVTIRRGNRTVSGPIWISFGHPDDCVTVQLGYGRTRAGHVAGLHGTGEETAGFDVYPIRTSENLGYATDAKLDRDPKDKLYGLACTQHHQLIDFTHPSLKDVKGPYAHENFNKQRDIVRLVDINEYKEKHGIEEAEHESQHISIYPKYGYDKSGLHKWGMVIDQTACIGCQACVTACQSENNIAVVGKEQVIFQREMHWLRIDTYYTGDPAAPQMLLQPMLCQHCETAPCEVVCPVAATSHSDEGINEMTYNRCVGTRYCGNNCPYKVRRFNFLQWNDNWVDALKLMRNPDVTVRNRGVMEKCSYCVQRVNQTRIELKKLDVEAIALEKDNPKGADAIREKQADFLADLQTACQQACPTEAIIFGDLNYNERFKSKQPLPVQKLKHQPEDTHYSLLTELNTLPRTTYLARFRNINPALATATEAKATETHGV